MIKRIPKILLFLLVPIFFTSANADEAEKSGETEVGPIFNASCKKTIHAKPCPLFQNIHFGASFDIYNFASSLLLSLGPKEWLSPNIGLGFSTFLPKYRFELYVPYFEQCFFCQLDRYYYRKIDLRIRKYPAIIVDGVYFGGVVRYTQITGDIDHGWPGPGSSYYITRETKNKFGVGIEGGVRVFLKNSTYVGVGSVLGWYVKGENGVFTPRDGLYPPENIALILDFNIDVGIAF